MTSILNSHPQNNDGDKILESDDVTGEDMSTLCGQAGLGDEKLKPKVRPKPKVLPKPKKLPKTKVLPKILPKPKVLPKILPKPTVKPKPSVKSKMPPVKPKRGRKKCKMEASILLSNTDDSVGQFDWRSVLKPHSQVCSHSAIQIGSKSPTDEQTDSVPISIDVLGVCETTVQNRRQKKVSSLPVLQAYQAETSDAEEAPGSTAPAMLYEETCPTAAMVPSQYQDILEASCSESSINWSIGSHDSASSGLSDSYCFTNENDLP